MNPVPDLPCHALSRRAALRHFSRPADFAACGLSAPAAWSQTAVTPRLPRIVSVNGAMTEIACALSAGPQLAGTDTASVFPPKALKTLNVDCMRQLSAEGVLSLRPGMVIGTSKAGQVVRSGATAEVLTADRIRQVWGVLAGVVQAAGQFPGGKAGIQYVFAPAAPALAQGPA